MDSEPWDYTSFTRFQIFTITGQAFFSKKGKSEWSHRIARWKSCPATPADFFLSNLCFAISYELLNSERNISKKDIETLKNGMCGAELRHLDIWELFMGYMTHAVWIFPLSMGSSLEALHLDVPELVAAPRNSA